MADDCSYHTAGSILVSDTGAIGLVCTLVGDEQFDTAEWSLTVTRPVCTSSRNTFLQRWFLAKTLPPSNRKFLSVLASRADNVL